MRVTLCILIAFMILMHDIDYVESLKCYNCSLSEQWRCLDLEKNLPKPDCPEPEMTLEEKKRMNIYPVCLKTIKKSKDPGNPFPYVDRSCGLFNGFRHECEELKEKGGWDACYVCTKPLCNESYANRPILFIVLMFFFFVVFYLLLFGENIGI